MSKSIVVISIIIILMSGCAPSEKAIQEAIAETQAAYTPTSSFTPTPSFTPTNTATPTITPTITPSPTPRFDLWNVQQAQEVILGAELEFSNPTNMTKDDYGAAPMSAAEGIHFYIPSLCADCGGRLYSFATIEDLALMEHYYTELGRQSAWFFSWVFVKDNILIQINGDLPEETAREYEAAINSLE